MNENISNVTPIMLTVILTLALIVGICTLGEAPNAEAKHMFNEVDRITIDLLEEQIDNQEEIIDLLEVIAENTRQ